jgi:hypothetical protein
MADVFDTLTEPGPKPKKRQDLFDDLTTDPAGGDVFDAIAPDAPSAVPEAGPPAPPASPTPAPSSAPLTAALPDDGQDPGLPSKKRPIYPSTSVAEEILKGLPGLAADVATSPKEAAAAAAYEGAGAVKGLTLGYVDPTGLVEKTPAAKADISKRVAEGAGQFVGALPPISKISRVVHAGMMASGLLEGVRPVLQGLVQSGIVGSIYGAARKPNDQAAAKEGELASRAHNALEDAATFITFTGTGQLVDKAAQALSIGKTNAYNALRQEIIDRFTSKGADPEKAEAMADVGLKQAVNGKWEDVTAGDLRAARRAVRAGQKIVLGEAGDPPAATEPAPPKLTHIDPNGPADATGPSGNAPPSTRVDAHSVGVPGLKYLQGKFPALADAVVGQTLPLEADQLHDLLTQSAAAGEEVLLKGGSAAEANVAALQRFKEAAAPLLARAAQGVPQSKPDLFDTLSEEAAQPVRSNPGLADVVRALGVQPHELSLQQYGDAFGQGRPAADVAAEHRNLVKEAVKAGETPAPETLADHPNVENDARKDLARDAAQEILKKNKIDDQAVVRLVDHIVADNEAFKAGYGTEFNPETHVIRGATRTPIDRRSGDRMQTVIDLADGAGPRTGRHEAFHAVSNILLDQGEQQILLDAFGNHEAAADAFADYRTGKSFGPEKSAIRAIFEKLTQFLDRLKNYFRAKKFATAEDIFDAVDRGEMAGRARGAKPGTQYKAAFHGSPHEFEKFDSSKLGTGEGAQAYGHGLYFSDKQEVAEFYRKTISAQHGSGKGKVYKVDIPEDYEFLNHDTLVADQSKAVRPKLEKINKELNLKVDPYESTGEHFYDALSEHLGGDAQASRYLASKGIPGLKYLDQFSRGAGQGTSNYVIFDDSRVKILEQYQAEKRIGQGDASQGNDENDASFTVEGAKIAEAREGDYTVVREGKSDDPAPQESEIAPAGAVPGKGGTPVPPKPPLRLPGALYDTPFAVEFRKTGSLLIPNRKISGPADLAYAFRFLHDELQENFFLGAVKNGRIVAVEHIGFGTLDQVAVHPYETLSLLSKHEADSYFLVHNHPSGYVDPSEQDKQLTKHLSELLGESGKKFIGHVVINGGKFGFIDKSGDIAVFQHKDYPRTKKLPILRKYTEWFRTKDDLMSAPVLNNPSKVVALTKSLVADQTAAVAYLLNVQNHILNAFVIPRDRLTVGYLQDLAASHRAIGVLLANSGISDDAFLEAQRKLKKAEIHLMDDVSVTPHGYRSKIEQLGEAGNNPYQTDASNLSEPGPSLYSAEDAKRDINRVTMPSRQREPKSYTERMALRRGLQLQSTAAAQGFKLAADRILGIQTVVTDAIQNLIPEEKRGPYLEELTMIQDFDTADKFVAKVERDAARMERETEKDLKKEGAQGRRQDLAERRKAREDLRYLMKRQADAAKEGAREATRQLTDIKKGIADTVAQYLPPAERGRFNKMIASANTWRDVIKAIGRIDQANEEYTRKLMVKALKREVQRVQASQAIAVDYRWRVNDLLQGVLFNRPTAATTLKAEQMQAYIDIQRKAGRDVTIPQYALNVLRTITHVPIDKIPTTVIEDVLGQVRQLAELGRTKFRTMKELDVLNKQRDLRDLQASTIPINSKPITRAFPGEDLSLGASAKNILGKAYNLAQRIKFSITPPDVLFDLLDGMQNFAGPNYRIFKARIDGAFQTYLDDSSKVKKELVEKGKGLSRKNFERIGVYAIAVQDEGLEKLANLGYTPEQIKSIRLTPQELTFYSWMRRKLDEARPRIAETMRVIYNAELGEVKNYFPFMTDFELADEGEMERRMIDQFAGFRKKNTEMGFTKERTGAGDQKVNIDALDVFSRHMDDVAYLNNVGPVTKYLGELANSAGFKALAGDFGTRMVRDWIDTLARKGGVIGGQQIAVLDKLRANVGAATLAFKLSSTLVQTTPLLEGGALIGNYALRGGIRYSLSPAWRRFVLDNMPEIRERAGDDPALSEFVKGGAVRESLNRAKEIGFWSLKKLDEWAAAGVAAGAYEKFLADRGLPIDLERPNKEGLAYAQRIVRRTQSSSFFKDTPLAITRGMLTKNRSFDRAIFQFQNFVLSQFSLLAYEGARAGVLNGRPGLSLSVWTWTILSILATAGIRIGLDELKAELIGERHRKQQDFEDELIKQSVQELVGRVPFLSQAMSLVTWGSMPVPAMEAIRKFGEGASGVYGYYNPDNRQLYRKRKPFKKALTKAITAGGQITGVPGAVEAGDLVRRTMK